MNQIGTIASIGSMLLSRPGYMRNDFNVFEVQLSRVKSQKPYRANENGKPFDAQFRVDRATSQAEPLQNNVLMFDDEEWIVWRITPSPANSHWVVDCMAPPTVLCVPIKRDFVDDGQGGNTHEWVDQLDSMFYAKLRESSKDRQLNAQTESMMGRLSMSYQVAMAPQSFGPGWRVRTSVMDQGYNVLSVTVDDENPAWHNAVLAREDAS